MSHSTASQFTAENEGPQRAQQLRHSAGICQRPHVLLSALTPQLGGRRWREELPVAALSCMGAREFHKGKEPTLEVDQLGYQEG